jgi:hypothetical protein
VADDHVFSDVREHLASVWPGRRREEFVWTLGPIVATLPSFRVMRIAPAAAVEPWVYASVGAWQADRYGSQPIEFFLLAPAESPLHVELLAMVANLHADPTHRIGLGSALEIGRPWIEGSLATHLLVSLPLPFGPRLEWLHTGGRHIRFLWLVPITDAEADLVRTQGLDALEVRLESSDVNLVDPNRASVA